MREAQFFLMLSTLVIWIAPTGVASGILNIPISLLSPETMDMALQ